MGSPSDMFLTLRFIDYRTHSPMVEGGEIVEVDRASRRNLGKDLADVLHKVNTVLDSDQTIWDDEVDAENIQEFYEGIRGSPEVKSDDASEEFTIFESIVNSHSSDEELSDSGEWSYVPDDIGDVFGAQIDDLENDPELLAELEALEAEDGATLTDSESEAWLKELEDEL